MPTAGNRSPFGGISLEQERHQLGRTGAVVRRDLGDRLPHAVDREAAGLQFGDQTFSRLIEQRGQLGQLMPMLSPPHPDRCRHPEADLMVGRTQDKPQKPTKILGNKWGIR